MPALASGAGRYFVEAPATRKPSRSAARASGLSSAWKTRPAGRPLAHSRAAPSCNASAARNAWILNSRCAWIFTASRSMTRWLTLNNSSTRVSAARASASLSSSSRTSRRSADHAPTFQIGQPQGVVALHRLEIARRFDPRDDVIAVAYQDGLSAPHATQVVAQSILELRDLDDRHSHIQA